MQVQRGRVRLSARTDVVIHPATSTFRAGRSQLNRYLQVWELKTSKSLQVRLKPKWALTFVPSVGIFWVLIPSKFARTREALLRGRRWCNFLLSTYSQTDLGGGSQ